MTGLLRMFKIVGHKNLEADLNFQKSDEYRRVIHNLIPGGAHTYSKGDDQFPQLAPAAISHGKGAYLWDLDGNKFLDCPMGLTSVSLGHAYEPVLMRVRKELEKGVNFQRPSYIEREMAEKFLEILPQHDRIKFAKNGSTATTAAVKLARAYTGRSLIAIPTDHPFYSYDDWFIGKTACSKGVPETTKSLSVAFDSRKLETLENLFNMNPNQIACVISEPERIIPMGEDYLEKVVEICHKNGALFIQDEMITGYKTAFPGSISKFKVVPDMATWGKGIANGFSFCALTGKKEIMDLGGITRRGEEKVFLISSTHGGETHAIAAGIATLEEFKEKDVIKHNQRIGSYLLRKSQDVINKHNLEEFVQVLEVNWMPAFIFKNKSGNASDELRTLVMQEMIKNGVLFQGSFVPCFSHTEQDIDFFVYALDTTLKIYTQALESGHEKFLVGPVVKPVFRKFL